MQYRIVASRLCGSSNNQAPSSKQIPITKFQTNFKLQTPIHMTKEEILAKVKALGLPQDSYIVFGSCPLAIAGIREAKDIDLFVSSDVLMMLKRAGWQEMLKARNDIPLVHDVFEAHDNWDFSPYNPTLEHLLSSATVVEGIPFASLEEVRKWKAASGRPNDPVDIKLIDKHLERK